MINESSNNPTLSAANMESDISNEPVGAKTTKGFNTRVNIRVISYRKYKHDPDGISVKAVLDGITRVGILADDSTKEVKEITFKSIICKKDEEEKTVIEIENIPN